jgi:hypothetical protein
MKSQTCTRCDGHGRIPALGHKDGGVCYACKSGKATVKSAERYLSKGNEIVCLRYSVSGDRHVVQVGVELGPVRSERFARVEDARRFWADARASLIEAGFADYVPF